MNLNITLVIQLVVFFILAWVTMKFIWPPLIAAIESAQRKIADGLASAEKAEKSLAPKRRRARPRSSRKRACSANKIVEQANRRSNELVEEARGSRDRRGSASAGGGPQRGGARVEPRARATAPRSRR